MLTHYALTAALRYNLSMPPRALIPLIRFAYRQFYNRFAFTYDAVSAVVSRGEWREWTRAALPFVRGTRILEIAFGTGNLLLDLHAAGHRPIGVDLSPWMIQITQRKLRERGVHASLVGARVQRLPFRAACFDSIVMTFPPGFVTDVSAMSEMSRVLAPDGRLIWVDAPYLYPRDAWARFLNFAYGLTGGKPNPSISQVLDWTSRADVPAAHDTSGDGWQWRVERIERPASYVHVMIGTPQKVADE